MRKIARLPLPRQRLFAVALRDCNDSDTPNRITIHRLQDGESRTAIGDAIDLMIGALGRSAMVALESAVPKAPSPLRGPLEETVVRIRLGDTPQAAFAGLHERFRLR